MVGPTAVGKTHAAILLARRLHAEIISADSRQMYRGMTIGTSKPSEEEQKITRHHFIDNLAIGEQYDASKFGEQVRNVLKDLFRTKELAILVGGSGLFVEAVWKEMTDFQADPSRIKQIRLQLEKELQDYGLEHLRGELKRCDPVHYEIVDVKNSRRVVRALEIYRATGVPISEHHRRSGKDQKKEEQYCHIKVGLTVSRERLGECIDRRVDDMVRKGLVEEARHLYPKRHETCLQSIGYREMFQHFDGACDMDQTIESIKKNTRKLAKRQMTWFRRYGDISWFAPDELEQIVAHIDKVQEDARRRVFE